MKLRRIEIERFRGIRSLTWDVGCEFVCLIGPGDSTKTTVLDAIELALSPRWSVPFDDTDFFQGDTSQALNITVTVSDIPEDLKSDARYGLLVRGWGPSGELHDEPEQGDDLALSIRLQVDASLEPEWTVVNDREPDGKRIRAKDRESLGCSRLGDFLDFHFGWGRGSVLSRLTSGADDLASIVAAAGRAARSEIGKLGDEQLASLRKAAKDAQRLGKVLGVQANSEYRPHLDVKAVSIGGGGMSLHDGEVPVRRAGLGTRRVLAMAMQYRVARDGGLTLIDEVESGLEPHRIRRLLQVLRRRRTILTTHAPVVLQELRACEVRIARSSDGKTTIEPVPEHLQGILRKASEAFLGRKVVVCEGKTEMGICRRMDEFWSGSGPSFGLAGVALALGSGGEAPAIAHAFAQLGYETALFADSDRPIEPDPEALQQAGVRVIQWSDGTHTEWRVARDLPWAGLVDVIGKACEYTSLQSVRDAIAGRLEIGSVELAEDPREWSNQASEDLVRWAFADAAHKKCWFKRVDRGEDLAAIILGNSKAIQDTDLWKRLEDIRGWAHGDD